jgi:hypothetical protein
MSAEILDLQHYQQLEPARVHYYNQLEFPSDFRFPSGGWGGDCFIKTSAGAKLRRWGSSSQAAKILGNCDKDSVYDLIKSGLIDAYKLKPHAPNSPWRIDLVSVQMFRNNQMAR